MTWEKLAQDKKKSIDSKIPSQWLMDSIPSPEEQPFTAPYLDSLLPKDEVAITSNTVLGLLELIKQKKLTSLEITKAFCHRAAFCHQMNNCLTEIMFEDAYKRAEELDLYFAQHGQFVGPLHGIPVSLKDQFQVEGYESSLGFTSLLGKYAKKEDESDLTIILRDAGAVFYVKTTVPMAMLGYETESKAFGVTLNSTNRKTSCGGSSGGEGSLIGARGSILGFGTDIGGSIRIPSVFQGIYGIKPSSHRLPYKKLAVVGTGQPILAAVVAPMAQDLDDLEYAFKLVLETKPWLNDARCPPIEFKDFKLNKAVSFGFMPWDEKVMPHPPILRAMRELRDKLKASYDVIDWKPPFPHDLIMDLVTGIFLADGLQLYRETAAITGEEIAPTIQKSYKKPIKPVTLKENWEQAKLKYKYQQDYDTYWNSTSKETKSGEPVDCWLLPGWGSLSFTPGEPQNSPSRYTRILNCLDYSTITVPIGYCDANIDVKDENYEPINELDRINYNYYDPKRYDGAPITIQLVCRRYEEEKVIKIAKLIRDVIN